MDHRKLVQPEYMNEQGSLFGGYLLKWLDEFAYITASIAFIAMALELSASYLIPKEHIHLKPLISEVHESCENEKHSLK